MNKLIILSAIGFLHIFAFCKVNDAAATQILFQMAQDNPKTQDNKATTFIILRHAEKEPAGKDPNLSSDGLLRAEALRYMFSGVDISAVYSTPYNRTRQTVNPLARDKGIPITEYPASKLSIELINEILAAHRGKTVVIVGHSNTVPEILKVLSGNSFTAAISESQYDNLFVVNYTDNRPMVMPLKYGKSTP
jgi:2,3-bisphosphoglycerate-dependent phosphoglycerate mutase